MHFHNLCSGIVASTQQGSFGQHCCSREAAFASSQGTQGAVSEPWIRTGRFEEQHAMLFSGKNALIKNVQHSDLLQARLQACQRDILAEWGSQGGGVVNVLRHFSLGFAAHLTDGSRSRHPGASIAACCKPCSSPSAPSWGTGGSTRKSESRRKSAWII